jgi:benzoate-CoA ligase
MLVELERGTQIDLSSIRLFLSAGERLLPKTAATYREQFGIEILDGIGSTEMLHHFIITRPGNGSLGSCGTPVPDCEIELRNDHGYKTADGEIGTIWIKSNRVFLGYWNKPRTYITQEGWVTTGDRFRRDVDQRYYFCGRLDDVVKVRGMRVAIGDVETVLRKHKAVKEASVIQAGEGFSAILVAFIVPHEGDSMSLIQLKTFLAESVPSYMIIDRLHVLISLPRTANGKIDRQALMSLQSLAINGKLVTDGASPQSE